MNLFQLIQAAILEDMPQGDVTTESLGLPSRIGKARLLAKQDLIVSGAPPFEETILTLEPMAKLKWHFDEGASVLKDQVLCTIQGDLVQILKAERIALNFIMHLSGIATFTHQFTEKVKPYKTRILDTRKTIPGYRDLEKKAVVHGGGINHRQNLSTAILIKDNHISLALGITPAVQRIRSQQLPFAITVEARTLSEVQDCVNLKVQRILLDNMDLGTLAEAMKMIPPEIETEASGNMTLDKVGSVAALGVNYISVGALTHSAPSVDLSLKFDWLSLS